jgi:hypothetical protein
MPIAPGLLTCVKTLAVQQQEESKAGLQWIFPFVSKQNKQNKQNAGFTKNVKPVESKVGFKE